MHDGNGRPSLAGAALRGALAGVAGGVTLMLVEQAERRTLLPAGSDTTSTAAAAVQAVASQHDAELSRPRAEAIGGGVALAWCAALGALFGVVQSRLDAPALLHGLALSALAYGATSSPVGVLTTTGTTPVLKQPLAKAIIPIGSELAFGITTAAAFEALS